MAAAFKGFLCGLPISRGVRDQGNAWNLAGMHTFARTHGKPFQIDEWGVWGPHSAPFIQSLATWLKANNIPSHTYWDSDAAYPGQLSTRQKDWPAPTAAFQQAFGKAKE